MIDNHPVLRERECVCGLISLTDFVDI